MPPSQLFCGFILGAAGTISFLRRGWIPPLFSPGQCSPHPSPSSCVWSGSFCSIIFWSLLGICSDCCLLFSGLSYNWLNHICCCQLEYVCEKERVICLCFVGFDEQLGFFEHMEPVFQLVNKHLSRTHWIWSIK